MEIQVSQDIRKFKTKDIGNFSFKEAGFIVIGAGLAYLVYTLTESIGAAVVPFGIVVAFAFAKPYGMSVFQFVRTVGKEKICPSVYINETDYEYDEDEIKKYIGNDYKVIMTENLTQSSSVGNKKTTKNIYEEALIIK